MPLDLPEPSTDKLARSPLILVVCQVQHEQSLAVQDPRKALAIHEALSGQYPDFAPQNNQILSIAAGSAGLQTLPSELSRGWRMRSDDGHWTAVVMPDNFALETTKYDDWADFSSRLLGLMVAVEATISPAIEQRLGLRMIDRLIHPDVEAPADWNGLLDPSFLGLISHEALGSAVVTTQQILELDAGDERRVILRHGAFRDPQLKAETYTLDHDCFIQRGSPLNMDRVIRQIESLHSLALQVFQAALREPLYSYLKGEES
jgi:uncharacterized protein (TIGR04255 family)